MPGLCADWGTEVQGRWMVTRGRVYELGDETVGSVWK